MSPGDKERAIEIREKYAGMRICSAMKLEKRESTRFSIPGGCHPLFDALYDHETISYTGPPRAGGPMYDGYARVTGRPGVMTSLQALV